MIQNKNQKIFTWVQIICMVMLCQNFFQLADSNGLILKNLTETKGFVLEIDLEYPEELHKLHTMIIH